MTGQEMYEHAREMAYELDTRVWICANCGDEHGGRATDTQVVFLKQTPDEPIAYLIALHELGHVASLNQWGKKRRVQEEVEAWRFALEHSKIEPTRAALRWAAVALLQYASHVKRDRRIKVTEDDRAFIRELLCLARARV